MKFQAHLPHREMDSGQELKEMISCVLLYYRHHKNQKEIAQHLGLSHSKVSRLLKRAYGEGIVRVELNLPQLPRLETALIEQFGLRDAVVIPGGLGEYTKEELGWTAARYFERVAANGIKVGLSCGYTLYHTIKNLREHHFRDLKIYPLSAESTLTLVDLFPNTLVGMMAAKYRPHVTAYALHAQLIAPLEEIDRERKLLLQNQEIRRILEEAGNVDVALLGIGSIGRDTPGFCTLAEFFGVRPDQLLALEVVGEINYQPFDAQGKIVEREELRKLTSRVLAVPASRLRELSRQYGKSVIAVAGGAKKAPSIRGVLTGGYCNILITDEEAALALLDGLPSGSHP
ncbi:MAG: helix-turn-helix domain-containing protein [Candidatus Tectomicrobia bacterium]|uniref:Helix-turn-helix domain-containing protein n=1 Tax=Tectimicrobiota bacterium TaxID=2528274 RepID=A0A932GMX4_UNCTE|nr:helix-turn-helix domain-containing protein [Candidatus Tectomicrobia bacterium]